VLQQQISEAGVGRHFHLLGERTDISRLMAGLDILASTSWTEAFPNVIGEAMASGVPCVVTDVGDSTAIVEKTGLVVPPRDPKGLAGALAALLVAGSDYRRYLGQSARQRVLDTYALPQISRQYEALYTHVLA
jgi:glycosyltransferase involved in cell wall biosynthesis